MHHLTYPSAWLPLLAGLALLVGAVHTGNLALLLMVLPAALLTAGGVRSLLFTDLRASQLVAIGAVLGILLSLALALLVDAGVGGIAALLCLLAFLASGWFQIAIRPELDSVPAPRPGILYSAQVAMDHAILGVMAVLTPVSNRDLLSEAVAESETAFAFMRDKGYLDDPRAFHREPPPLTDPVTSTLRAGGLDGTLLRWDSGFEPPAGLPGGERLLAQERNRTAQALLLRHAQPAPWLVCVHGFGMGDPRRDMRSFRAAQLHAMGLNLALIALPFHGPRAPGRIGGEGFFGLSPLDFTHAESQAIWDLRRLIGWLRSEGATRVGVYGISLGAYTSAVLAALDGELDCVIAGIPPTDMTAHGEYLASPVERREWAIAGVDFRRDRAVQSVVAPLALAPLVPREARFIYAATGDQFVPVEQVHALWQHWQQPQISWCRGGHTSALMQKLPREFVVEAVRATLLRETD